MPPRSWRLICPILDTGSEALSNERGYSRSLFGKGQYQSHAGTLSRQQIRLQTYLPRMARDLH